MIKTLQEQSVRFDQENQALRQAVEQAHAHAEGTKLQSSSGYIPVETANQALREHDASKLSKQALTVEARGIMHEQEAALQEAVHQREPLEVARRLEASQHELNHQQLLAQIQAERSAYDERKPAVRDEGKRGSNPNDGMPRS